MPKYTTATKIRKNNKYSKQEEVVVVEAVDIKPAENSIVKILVEDDNNYIASSIKLNDTKGRAFGDGDEEEEQSESSENSDDEQEYEEQEEEVEYDEDLFIRMDDIYCKIVKHEKLNTLNPFQMLCLLNVGDLLPKRILTTINQEQLLNGILEQLNK